MACVLATQIVAPADPPARFAEEVVVTAERAETPAADTAATVSVLSGEEARTLPAEALSGLLGSLPGLQVIFGEGYGLTPMVQARGFFGGGEAEYLQLIVDGLPVGDAESGLADWRHIRSTDIERVEVLHGPGSALYGDTALGGVVQVFTRSGGTTPLREAGMSAASHGSWSADGVWRGRVAGLHAGAHAFAARTRGFRAHSATEEAAATVSVASGARPSHVVFTLSASARDREDPGPLDREHLAGNRFASDALFAFDRERSARGRAALAFRTDRGPYQYLVRVHAAARDTAFLRTLLIAAGVGERALRDVDTRTAGVTLEGKRSTGGPVRARAGADVASDDADIAYRAVDDGGRAGTRLAEVGARRDRIGLFAAGDWRLSRRLRVTAGLRWDGIADDAGPALGGRTVRSAWSPRGGLTVRLGGSDANPSSAYVQVSRAFKAPSIDQLVDPRPFPDFQGGTFTISNPRLQPQRAASVEAGLSHRARDVRWEVVAYRMAVEDEIDFDPATFRYANIGRSLHRGLEASARLFADRRLSPRLSYAWTRVGLRDPGAAGRQLKNIPEHVLRVGLAGRLPAAVIVAASVGWSGRRFLDDGHLFPLAGSVLFDARVQRSFRRIRLRLDATNIASQDWEAVGYALPDGEGRPVPYVFPGARRAVRAGLDVLF